MAPKGLLRDARLASPLDDFLPGKVFEPVLGEPHPEVLAPPTPSPHISAISPMYLRCISQVLAPPTAVRRLLLCSGRLYFELDAARLGLGVGLGVG